MLPLLRAMSQPRWLSWKSALTPALAKASQLCQELTDCKAERDAAAQCAAGLEWQLSEVQVSATEAAAASVARLHHPLPGLTRWTISSAVWRQSMVSCSGRMQQCIGGRSHMRRNLILVIQQWQAPIDEKINELCV